MSSAQSTRSVLFEKRGKVAVITLNTPAKLNATSVDMLDELKDALVSLAKDSRVIILRGEGRAFCSGKAFLAGLVIFSSVKNHQKINYF